MKKIIEIQHCIDCYNFDGQPPGLPAICIASKDVKLVRDERGDFPIPKECPLPDASMDTCNHPKHIKSYRNNKKILNILLDDGVYIYVSMKVAKICRFNKSAIFYENLIIFGKQVSYNGIMSLLHYGIIEEVSKQVEFKGGIHIPGTYFKLNKNHPDLCQKTK